MNNSFAGRVFSFYHDGFRAMRLGRTLWRIILLKLFIIFGIIKLFFFPNYLNSHFADDEARARHVLESITAYPPEHQKLSHNSVP